MSLKTQAWLAPGAAAQAAVVRPVRTRRAMRFIGGSIGASDYCDGNYPIRIALQDNISFWHFYLRRAT
jgi:hypothetical protein